MMMKKNVAGMKGAAGRPGRPGLALNSSSSTPFSALKPQPQQQTFARNPNLLPQTGTQSNQSPPPKIVPPPMFTTQGMYGMKKGGKVKPKKMMDGGMAYSKGGSASSRADGIARKGKTKGKMV